MSVCRAILQRKLEALLCHWAKAVTISVTTSLRQNEEGIITALSFEPKHMFGHVTYHPTCLCLKRVNITLFS